MLNFFENTGTYKMTQDGTFNACNRFEKDLKYSYLVSAVKYSILQIDF